MVTTTNIPGMPRNITIEAGEDFATAFDRAAHAEGVESAIRIEIPDDEHFVEEGVDFLEAPDIENLGRRLRVDKPTLHALSDYKITYLWKRTGGASGGRNVLGKCLRTPPMVKTFAPSTWTIWLAADNCREFRLTDRQFEALVFHELLHCDLAEKEVTDKLTGEVTTEYRPAVRGHDLETFMSEVDEYGFWTSELQRAGDTFARQAELPGMDGQPVAFGGVQ